MDAKCEELGIVLFHTAEFIVAWRTRDLGSARAALGESRAEAAFDEGRRMTWEQAIELASGGASVSLLEN